ncbi:MAG TPA: efflux RND transporter periplasmic adaptor subunit [Myxococcales bacterium]
MAVLFGCHKAEDKPDEPQALAVSAAPVERGDVANVVEVAGTLEPLPGMDVKLAPLVQGRLARVLVAEGDRVKAGQVLAQLEATPLRDAVAQAEAQLAQARAQAANASAKLSRARQAFDAGVAAGQEVDDAKLADESARSSVRTAEAALSTARNAQARGELRAPFDGVVAKVSAASGEPVDPSRTVVEVARIDSLELRAPVSPAVAQVLHAGQAAEIDGQKAVVAAVAPVVDPTTGSLLVRIRVPNPQYALKANSAARARVVADVHRGVLTVPKAALTGGDPPSIEVVEQGKAKQVNVRTGYDDGQKVEIVEGPEEPASPATGRARTREALVKVGDQVIVQGGYAVPDGTPVTVSADAGPRENAPAKADAPDKPEAPSNAPEKGADKSGAAEKGADKSGAAEKGADKSESKE